MATVARDSNGRRLYTAEFKRQQIERAYERSQLSRDRRRPRREPPVDDVFQLGPARLVEPDRFRNDGSSQGTEAVANGSEGRTHGDTRTL